MDKNYWNARIESYREMIAHIKKQKAMAEPEEKVNLSVQLEQLFNEINVIQEHIGKTPQ